jgi:phosphonate transport system substrate-binding protein
VTTKLKSGPSQNDAQGANIRRAAAFLKRSLHWRLVSVFLSVLLSASALADTYTVGVVPQFETRRMFKVWQPILDALGKQTGDKFILEVPLTVPQFERELEKGRYDFIYANPYHVMRVGTYDPLVRDSAPLRGILVVRKDSPIHDLRQLNGKTLAVPSPNALGASLLLRADLEREYGVKVTMVNCRTHSSVYLNVLNELTDAGGGVQKTFNEQDPQVRDALRIIYTTRDMPSHPFAAQQRIPKAVREKVRKAFLELAATPSGKAMLDKVPMQNPVPASLDEYLVMRKWGLENYWVSGAN